MNDSDHEWIGVSDLMTGLMMVFLFIAVLFMVKIENDTRAVKKIAVTYNEYKHALNVALHEEFDDDLKKWNAEILADNTIRFKGPEVLFASESSKIKYRFKNILDEFFPRYVRLLAQNTFKKNIDEIRIEGHTSSEWEGVKTLDERYLKNADLSQTRSFAVLAYCFQLSAITSYQEWLTETLRANGLAFAKSIRDNGVENRDRSRRVEFRVKTKAEEKIEEIIRTLQPENVQ